jgi:hypothetical protein
VKGLLTNLSKPELNAILRRLGLPSRVTAIVWFF